jgi:hypothetical protein
MLFYALDYITIIASSLVVILLQGNTTYSLMPLLAVTVSRAATA